MKGKMMRKFMEASVGKEASFVDGIKIILSPKTWVLMLPDQHADFVHLFIQAHTDDEGEAIFKEFADKIVEWINE
jgi:mannose-1-phosphate guanylyltransferase/phosphomannomutase